MLALAPDGRVITGSDGWTIEVWRNGACERTIEAHTRDVAAVAVLPGGARFVNGNCEEEQRPATTSLA